MIWQILLAACAVLKGIDCASFDLFEPLEKPLLDVLGSVSHLPSKSVAIIGGGAGGTSAAYHLRQFAKESGFHVDITVYEAQTYIGGRSTTVNAFGDSKYPIELGASIFVQVNSILMDAVSHFNLSLEEDDKFVRSLGVWNGHDFVWEQYGDKGLRKWWDNVRMLAKYGLEPLWTTRLVDRIINQFLGMYSAPTFPFESLSTAISESGLTDAVSTTGEIFLQSNGLHGAFAFDIVQAAVRVNYAQNLNGISGMGSMVSLAAEGAKAVKGGNWQIFEHFARSANRLYLNTSVTHLKSYRDGSVSVRSSKADESSYETVTESIFDEVIVAAPFRQTNITIRPSSNLPGDVAYVELHVTLFTSDRPLSAQVFGRSASESIPDVIVTTLQPEERVGTSPGETAGRVGFFSISKIRSVENPLTGGVDFVYKIFSPSLVSDQSLRRLLDGRNATWIHRKVWKSYPYLYPRSSFSDCRLLPGVWYTGGMDTFISTMETNALMGQNIARLIIDKWNSSRNASL